MFHSTLLSRSTGLVFAATLLGCSRGHAPDGVAARAGMPNAAAVTTTATPIAARFAKATNGSAYRLVLSDQALLFCDNDGPHALRLSDRGVTRGIQACPQAKPTNACQDDAKQIDTRTPEGGPNDIVDGPDGQSYPQRGLVHDCAIVGDRLLVGTGSVVVLIDTTTHRVEELGRVGSDAVALTANWAAWSGAGQVHVLQLARSKGE